MDRRTLWALALLVACLSCAPRHAAGACTPLQLAHFKERWAGQKAPCQASKLVSVTAGCAKWAGQAAQPAPPNWALSAFGSCGVGQSGSQFCSGALGPCAHAAATRRSAASATHPGCRPRCAAAHAHDVPSSGCRGREVRGRKATVQSGPAAQQAAPHRLLTPAAPRRCSPNVPGSCQPVTGWCVSDYKLANTFDQASLPDQDSPSLSYCCCPGSQ